MSEPQYCPIARKFCRCEWRCEDAEAVADYVDAMIRRDMLTRNEGDPRNDWSTRGEPLKPGQ